MGDYMSAENVKKFRKDLEDNTELKETIKKELEAYKDSGKKEREIIPEIARKLGYDFTDEEFKETNKIVSDEELSNVSGGKFWCGEDAPDGHELDCILMWYHGWQHYYWLNHICENCKSKNVRSLVRNGPFVCNDCGHYTYNPASSGGTSPGSC